MKKPAVPTFSVKTLEFLKKASRQKREDWLEKQRDEYESAVLNPLQYLARQLKSELNRLVPDYNFPQKSIGRLKRPAHRAAEYGSLYKNWVSYSAARPRTSRFEHNPNLFFLINTEDPKDPVLLAGGLYMPSSRQLRKLRETIAEDATAFERLFATKEFSRSFADGFSDEKTATRPPRGFDPDHPKMKWLKLQAFFVWKPYTRREFASRDFFDLVTRDCRQILRLNALLDKALDGRLPVEAPKVKVPKSSDLLARLENIKHVERKMDF